MHWKCTSLYVKIHMCITTYYVMKKFCICLFCFIAGGVQFWFLCFMMALFHVAKFINQNKVVYYRSFMTFQTASHVCNFFKTSEYFIELSKNRQRQSTYRLSKAKYNYQIKQTKVKQEYKQLQVNKSRQFPKQITKRKQKDYSTTFQPIFSANLRQYLSLLA